MKKCTVKWHSNGRNHRLPILYEQLGDVIRKLQSEGINELWIKTHSGIEKLFILNVKSRFYKAEVVKFGCL